MSYEDYLRLHFTSIFKCQKNAFDNQNMMPGSRVFAFESPDLRDGRRNFICASPEQFYYFYKHWEEGRWFYEVIREGVPCRPYFDLEFYTEFNPDLNAMKCFEDFISICKEVFRQHLDIQLEDNNLMILDSTTGKKFSSHVIVHLPGKRLFPSNEDLKPLINIICNKMREERKCIVIKDDKGNEEFLCDRAVYSKNRNFRLWKSSKCGKNVKLEYADYCKFDVSITTREGRKQGFFDTLVVPNNLDEHSLLDVKSLVEISKSMQPLVSTQTTASQNYDGMRGDTFSGQQSMGSGYRVSIFPELDSFVCGLMGQVLNRKVEVSAWKLFYDQMSGVRKLSLQFRNCRYCYNIMREHKSNQVYWIVDLEVFVCVQRCFDIECRYFQSEPENIPDDIRKAVESKLDQKFSSRRVPFASQLYTEVIIHNPVYRFTQ